MRETLMLQEKKAQFKNVFISQIKAYLMLDDVTVGDNDTSVHNISLWNAPQHLR